MRLCLRIASAASLLLLPAPWRYPAEAEQSADRSCTVVIDPITRYLHITYQVSAGAPDEVAVTCTWSPAGKNEWHPAKVMPFVSETGLAMAPSADWERWHSGRLIECRAAGLRRTVVFNPYPEAQVSGIVDADFRIAVQTTDGKPLAESTAHIQADNSSVVYIEDWSKILQKDAVVTDPDPQGRKWSWRSGLDAASGMSCGNALEGKANADNPLPQLSFPLDLHGVYAVYVCTDPRLGGAGMRLSGDERADYLASRHPAQETLWAWRRMDRQNLVLHEQHEYTGWAAASVDYIKLVPLAEEQVQELDDQFGKPDKLIAGYFEPYSWAFRENVQGTLQHREPLTAFAEARISLVDIQVNRFGMKAVYETRQSDPLLYSTIGDPIGSVAQPTTDNVGRMQQFTNTLDAELRYTRELGLRAHANFGASACYVGSPLQGDFAKNHPDWVRSACLRYEVPEVRQYVFSLFREALEIGAPGLSIDFCRYPECIDTADTCNAFLAELRKLADEAGSARTQHVPILVRFPGKGVRLCENFDYGAWAKQGYVDYLCPSNIQGRHMNIDITPYLEAVRGTKCALLPCVDALEWGLPMPGPYLWRVARLYEAGVPGIYMYQADGRVLGRPEDRRCVRLLSSSEAVKRWWERDRQNRPNCSKGIYITYPMQIPGYHPWERLRIWLEGVEMREVEMYVDDKLATRADAPPYLLGTEEYASDGVIPPGNHTLRVRAKDGDGWLEKKFSIVGAS
ncbi:MAG: hypothetical protein HZB26_20780 [Candidatus Hydrogenedentes bacterium]|nr:hypothetical protein [Candidatus Hydrogenedentota bacterium]